MTDPTASDVDPLQAVLALTPAGREELREPHSGLSLPQRWLLSHLDGRSRLADLVDQPGSPTAARLPRDAAKLVRLGLIVAIGGAGLAASAFGPSTLHGDLTLALPLDDGSAGKPLPAPASIAAPRAPRLLAAVMLMAAGGAVAYWAAAGSDRRVPDAVAGGPAPATVAASAAGPVLAGALPASTPSEPTPAREPLQVTAGVPAADPTLAPRPRVVAAASAVARSRSAPEASTVGAVVAAAVVPSPAPSPVQATPEATPAPAAPVVIANVALPGPAAPSPSPAQPSVVPATAAGGAAPPAGPTVVSPAPAPAPTSTLPPAVVAPPAQPAVVTPGTALRPVSMVEPNFPREGLGLGSRAVLLQARLSVDASGAVTQVNFVQGNASTRPFERSARAALLQWRFPAGAPDRVYSQQVRFSEE